MGQAQARARRIRDTIRGNFDRGAGAYRRFEADSSFFRELLEQLLALGPGVAGGRVLDVGCGTGASLGLLREKVGPAGWAVGLDLSLPMLREARCTLGAGVPLVALDGCAFGSAFRRSFTAVVYNAVAFMLPDVRGSLESAASVLESGGHVYLSTLEGIQATEGAVIEALVARGMAPGRHAVSSWPTVEGALRALFDVTAIARWNVRLTPAQFEAFYGLEPMSAGLMPGMPYPQRRQAVQELARQWEVEGRCVEQAWLLACARNP